MERTNAPVLAGRAGDRLTRGLNDIIERHGLPFVAYNQGSIVHLETSGVMLLDLHASAALREGLKPRKHMMEEMGAAYMANGLITLAGSRMYTSMADTDEVDRRRARALRDASSAASRAPSRGFAYSEPVSQRSSHHATERLASAAKSEANLRA